MIFFFVLEKRAIEGYVRLFGEKNKVERNEYEHGEYGNEYEECNVYGSRESESREMEVIQTRSKESESREDFDQESKDLDCYTKDNDVINSRDECIDDG